ncbi:hypothetical protein A2995_00580 [Candidatus Nomurabacteria bacterium RIFCSPLOWO2_01_FULL_33_24]|uniref:Lipoprotein n=1 Tax=Candidatus Nomurabacteria bacterium RIFCSPLOWO2_01_FULL_33_24 TaxID=1801765 RepID=A0A1F6X0U8_9BACT|nr:MAG: hypothetical protein A2995_00580 [Candidatus Nomurabacteria bacterium RIFCSPLOWO2_01_FULL_33_24]
MKIKYFLILFLLTSACTKKRNVIDCIPGWEKCSYKSQFEASKKFKFYHLNKDQKEIIQGLGILPCRTSYKIFVFEETKNNWSEIKLPPEILECKIIINNISIFGFKIIFSCLGKNYYYHYCYKTGKWQKEKEVIKKQKIKKERNIPQNYQYYIKNKPRLTGFYLYSLVII